MEIIPPNYETKSNLTLGEKRFIREVKKKFPESLFILNVFPFQNNGEKTIDKHHCLITQNSVILFKPLLNIDKIEKIKSDFLQMFHKDRKESLYELLTRHNKLVVKEGKKILKFPIEYKFLLSEINKTEIDFKNFKKKKNTIENLCLFRERNFYSDNNLNLNNFESYLLTDFETPHLKNYVISSEDISAITNMIAPEYAIPYKDHDIKKQNGKNTEVINFDCDIESSEDEILIKSFKLDEEQIEIINNLRSGHQLILACAGSGKSVILLSKAMKLAKENPKKNILLTCYNKNLADYYVWRSTITGSNLSNLEICTFHKLTKKLLKNNNLTYRRNVKKYEENIHALKTALEKGNINNKYHGIFIDEIQVFKTEWYKICYDLLESHDTENYIFTICGDISQNLNKDIKKGQATWNTESDNYPKYTGRSIRINKNYRNTIEINDFIVNFLDISKEKMKKYNINYTKEEEVFLKGKAFRHGVKPKIIKTDRRNLTSKIITEIKRIKSEKKYALSETAILFPFKKFKTPLKYYFFYWIKNKLEEEKIDFSRLISDGKDYPDSIEFRSGVNLVTINSALGLDFDVVLLAGLYPLGFYNKSKDIHNKNKGQISSDMKEEFHSNINKIYTAITRARQELIIFLDDDTNNYDSIYNQIIIEALKRSGGNEY